MQMIRTTFTLAKERTVEECEEVNVAADDGAVMQSYHWRKRNNLLSLNRQDEWLVVTDDFMHE
ncbi:hypothetical protein GN244_ATG17008 [Phytophthora infestans]|uniref:Uncharacterized protein n=1 Tax=Phytophthora infestans TaxID=4787 RepID=A0A833SZM8_PHYIN|nr:hypothetical protein GN244_ATG17008 [Phytophthora infestans]